MLVMGGGRRSRRRRERREARRRVAWEWQKESMVVLRR